MERKTVIIYQTTPPECYGSLKQFCNAKRLSYNTFSKKPLPFNYKDAEVYRVPFSTGFEKNKAGRQKNI